MVTMGSIHSPQFTQRQAGDRGASVISNSNELVKPGIMSPWQRPQIPRRIKAVLGVVAEFFMGVSRPLVASSFHALQSATSAWAEISRVGLFEIAPVHALPHEA